MTTGATTGYYDGYIDKYAVSTTTTKTSSTQGDKNILDSVFGKVGSGNTCTDKYVDENGDGINDNDDGKIGFFSAVANVAQGAVRGATNLVTGAFCNDEGKFSFGKTLKTVALTGLFVAANVATGGAAGVALGVLGAGVGAYKVGSGIANAVSADTDEEAKAAWEKVGSGALDVGLSAMAISKAAGTVDKVAKAADAAEGLGEAETAAEEVGEMAEAAQEAGKAARTASKFGKLTSLGQNMVKATKYSMSNIKQANAKDLLEAAQISGDTAEETARAARGQKGIMKLGSTIVNAGKNAVSEYADIYRAEANIANAAIGVDDAFDAKEIVGIMGEERIIDD